MAERRRANRAKRKRGNPLLVVVGTGGILLVLLVVLLVGGKAMIRSWLRGDEFRDWLVGQAETALEARIDLEPLAWQGGEVYSDRLLAEGYEGAAFSELELEGIRAKLGGIEDQAFRVPDISVNRFDLVFSEERVEAAPGERQAGGGTAEEPAAPEWLRRYLPNRAEIDRIGISSARVLAENSAGETSFLLNGVETEIRPDLETGMWEIDGRGGRMRIPGQPEIDVKQLALRWRGAELFLDRCAIGIYGSGHVEGTGEISFAEDGTFDLELLVSGIRVDDLVDGEWEERLSGVVSGPVRVTGKPGAFVYEGDVVVSEAVIESVPVLSVIAKYTRNERFERLVLSEATTHFRSEGEQVLLTDVALQSDGLARVEGDLVVENGRIAGAFEVGVMPGTLRWIPGAERKVFVEERDGFLWTSMELSGTMDEPVEDLSGRLIAAAGESLIGDLPPGLIDQAEKFLNPDSGAESGSPSENPAGSLLDLLTPFLR